MGFKLNNKPYDRDDMNIPVYRKELKDGSAGKSNHTGIVVDINAGPKMEEAVVAHETVHQLQQRNGDLDYDNENFYWKGKVYPRKNLNEHDKNLPWEVDAYKKSDKILANKDKDKKLIGVQNDGASVVNPKKGKTVSNLSKSVRYDLYKEGVGGNRGVTQQEMKTMSKDKDFMNYVSKRDREQKSKPYQATE
jgi:hypothetical protein